jgi:hypothetical protein
MHFEVFFYLVFIPVSFFQVKPIVLAGISLLTGLAFLLARIDAPFIISYCFGIVFWATGLIFAHVKLEDTKYPTSYFIALVLLLFCYQQVEVGQYLINHIDLPTLPATSDMVNHPVRLVSMQFLPLCALILAAFNNKRIPWHRTVLWLMLLPPVGRIFYLVYAKPFDENPAMLWSIALFLLSISLLLFPFQLRLRRLDKGLAFLGSISYGTYLIHAPIMFLFLRFEPFSGSAITAFVRLGLYLATTFTAAYALQKLHKLFVEDKIAKFQNARALDYTMS